VATGGGSDTVSVMRFLQDSIVVRVGDTVEWTNLDPVTPHTVTFGTEPADVVDPSAGVSVGTDGTRQATITSSPAAASVHSGFLQPSFQDRFIPPPPGNLPQSPLGVTRFRVTFSRPGTFTYICALHDDLGMKGQVIVHR
jgi:plastocyanin